MKRHGAHANDCVHLRGGCASGWDSAKHCASQTLQPKLEPSKPMLWVHYALLNRQPLRTMLCTISYYLLFFARKGCLLEPCHGSAYVCVEHIELPAKLLDDFLRNNKGNINQLHACVCVCVCVRERE